MDAERAGVRRGRRPVVQAALCHRGRAVSVGGRRARTRVDRLRADRSCGFPALGWTQCSLLVVGSNRRDGDVMKAIAAGFAFLLLAVPAQAQTDDARWEPWIGCWELATENIGEGAPAAGRLSGSGVTQRPSGAFPRVCVTRAGNGVRVETTV